MFLDIQLETITLNNPQNDLQNKQHQGYPMYVIQISPKSQTLIIFTLQPAAFDVQAILR